MKSRWALLAVFLVHCSWCAAPKRTPEEDLVDRDAAPHAEERAPRCSVQSTIALPGTFEIGRAVKTPTGVLLGARRGAKGGILEIAGGNASFTAASDLVGDVPPPLPLVAGDHKLAVEYEGEARHLVVRDVAAPDKPVAELAHEPPDDSLAYDATVLADGSILVAWDASAVFATLIKAGHPSTPTRLSPSDVDADTPRLVLVAPNVLVVAWLAHRPVAEDAGSVQEQALEAPGQPLDHAWVEMQTFDVALHPTSPLRHLTPDTGRISSFELEVTSPTSVVVIARDAVELQAGQGGSAAAIKVTLDAHVTPVRLDAASVPIAGEHVGRGLPLRSEDMSLFVDPENRGHSVVATRVAPEPSLDAARPLTFLKPASILVVPETGAEVRVLQCVPLP